MEKIFFNTFLVGYYACGRSRSIRFFHNSNNLSKGAFPYYNKHKPVTDPARQDPDYFENEAKKLILDENYLDNLKFLWEEKIGSHRELALRASDLLIGNKSDYGLPDIDKSQPRLPYRNVDILKNAPESVQKIFSVDMGERIDLTAAWKHELINKVKISENDKSSLQIKIAWATACIRHFTALADHLLILKKKRPTWLLHRIYLFVGWRTKMLRTLRKKNLDEFEKIIKELKIAYSTPKEPEHLNTRKAWSEHQLRLRCTNEKEKKLQIFYQQLIDGREEKVASIDMELSNLEKEESAIKNRLLQIKKIEGKFIENNGKYEPKLIEEFSEIMLHSILFYHPPPSRNFSSGIPKTF